MRRSEVGQAGKGADVDAQTARPLDFASLETGGVRTGSANGSGKILTHAHEQQRVLVRKELAIARWARIREREDAEGKGEKEKAAWRYRATFY